MKTRVCLLGMLLLSSLFALAQNTANLVIFSEDGDAFYAYVNGVKQNNSPETNVKITNLNPNVSLRIVFENAALPQLKQMMNLEGGFEHSARIKRDPKKQVKLRYFGSVPLNQGATGVKTVEYHTAEDNSNYNTAPTNDQNNINQSTTVTNNSSTQQTNSSVSNGNNNASVNVSVPGININMNVNATGQTTGANANTTTTVTSSTSSSTTTSTTYNNNTHADHQGHQAQPQPAQPVDNGNTAMGASCRVAMSEASFNKMKESIASKPFSDTKMSTAKVATKNACLSTNQIKEIAKLFSMDEDKLTYTKYAYDRCVDKANFYQASDIFSFSSTVDDFNAFLETK